MTFHRSTFVSVFTEPREAIGWLASLWAGSLIPVVVWPWLLLQGQLFDAPTTWMPAASTIVILCMGGINVWGYWVSSEARPRLKQATRHGRLPWWQRERFASEHAAERLGWAPRPIVWMTRALMLLASGTTLAAPMVLASKWW